MMREMKVILGQVILGEKIKTFSESWLGKFLVKI